MFTLSTCWKSFDAKDASGILNPIVSAGIRMIELEYRITEEIFREMLPMLRRGELSVPSVHNFFPVPVILNRNQASGDAFLLSSPDKEERELALKYTLRTFEHAHEAGASAVILHLGRTNMDDGFDRLKREYEEGTLESASAKEFARSLVEERRKIGGKYLDAALFSLDKLWRPAERLSIKLGIENRYGLNEVPAPDELSILLEKFSGSNIGYWHDVGHAAVQELFYGFGHERLLSELSKRLLGVHLHDVEGYRDHQAPGKGKVDFKMVQKYVPASAIRVIEVGPEVSDEALRDAIQFLSQNDLIFMDTG